MTNPAVPPAVCRFLSWYCVWWTLATMETGTSDFRSTYPEEQYAKRRRRRAELTVQGYRETRNHEQ